MDRILPRLATLIALGCLAIPHGLAAQITPVGPEVRADTITFYNPLCPHLAVGSDRSFEIVWDYNSLGDQSVYGRHVSASGEPTDPMQVLLVGGDFYLYTVADFVTATPQGFQVFTTTLDTQLELPPSHDRRRLDRNGVPLGPAEPIKLTTLYRVRPDGTLYSIFAQSQAKNLVMRPVLPNGTAQGPRIVLNTRSIDLPFPVLGSLSGDDFVVVWSGVAKGRGSRQVIRGRIVRNGVPVGQDFDVNTMSLRYEVPPSAIKLQVAGAPSGGGFAVVWVVEDIAFNSSIHLRFFDASGRPRTPEVIAVPGAYQVTLHSAALDSAGNLLLLWTPRIQTVLRVRLFSAANGAPLGPAYQLSTGGNPCGEAAWAGDSWIITYQASIGADHTAVFWRRFKD